MKIDAPIITRDPSDAADLSSKIEASGFDGLCTFEGPHEPFLPLAVAASNTKKINLITSIAIAFARNPMLLANIGYDLQLLSKGRFIMGLGSQIKPHIEKRFSMPWSSPANRMREMIQAIKSIWECWENGTQLNFMGEFYSHTLMTPLFNPGKHEYGLPDIYLAGVGPLMTCVAAEVADGLLVHPFHSVKSLQAITLPAVDKGLNKSKNKNFKISIGAMVAAADDQDELDQAINGLRMQLGFYGSTPAYKVVLEEHGWENIHFELNKLSKKGAWDDMPKLINDEMLETIAIVGSINSAKDQIHERYSKIAERVAPTFFNPNAEAPFNFINVFNERP